MFKQITGCILMVVISLQILNRTVIYIDYYANSAAYAKKCENKVRPTMHCNGKCQMMKKLQQEEKKESQLPPERKSTNDDVISSKSFFNAASNVSKEVAFAYNIFPVLPATRMPRSCFHPPGHTLLTLLFSFYC